ncbi:MAG: di-trans,poly-cis-decaprenylcistransferase [Spirochaetales bacterium]|nr:di-trans,poly-cis-decaprenylcistransferase [Spirochaetales bacterium]
MDDTGLLPKHIGIIMDGNGRWAIKRKLPRTAGHKEGLDAAKVIVKAASDIGIRYLTLYIFSTENWKRTGEEVSFLMRLIKSHLRKEYDFYVKNHIRVVHSGDLLGLPEYVQNEIRYVSDVTKNLTGMTVNIAINYGGRDEILRAFSRWRKDHPDESPTEEELSGYLDNPDIPDPDLIIRTGGEKRLSNFLLWGSAYAEYYFSDKLWPDWNTEDLREALEDFQGRLRKYGGIT